MLRSPHNWLRRLGSARPARRAPRFRPCPESLEDRLALSMATPAAVTFNNQLHVFQVGDLTGDLYDHYWDGQWHWQDVGHPAWLAAKAPAAVAYGGNLHVFATSNDGHLYDYCWNGQGNPSSGTWGDRSADGADWGPGTLTGVGTPAAVVYQGALHLFLTSSLSDTNFRNLYDDVFSGGGWQWHNVGSPGQLYNDNHPFLGADPAAVVANNVLHVYVTTNADDTTNAGDLYDIAVTSAGAARGWTDLGNGGASLAGRTPAAVATRALAAASTDWDQVHVFVTGTDGNLYEWRDASVPWHNHGHGDGLFHGTPAAVVYGGNLHAYVTDDQANLYDYYTDGANEHFDKHGNGRGWDINRVYFHQLGDPAVVVYGGNLHVYVPDSIAYTGVLNNSTDLGTAAAAGELYDHYWDGSWHWDNHGNEWGALPAPPATMANGLIAAGTPPTGATSGVSAVDLGGLGGGSPGVGRTGLSPTGHYPIAAQRMA